jgi:hypothetical protein
VGRAGRDRSADRLRHGLGDDHGLWRHVVPPLTYRHETIAIDMPGQVTTPSPEPSAAAGRYVPPLVARLPAPRIEPSLIARLAIVSGLTASSCPAISSSPMRVASCSSRTSASMRSPSGCSGHGGVARQPAIPGLIDAPRPLVSGQFVTNERGHKTKCTERGAAALICGFLTTGEWSTGSAVGPTTFNRDDGGVDEHRTAVYPPHIPTGDRAAAAIPRASVQPRSPLTRR